jgi:histidyl-tRNA synthetase
MSRPRFEDITMPLRGFVDATGVHVSAMRYAEAEFARLFTAWGYGEIRVPIVERASSFSEEVIGGSPWPEWDKRGVFYVQLQNYAESYTDLPDQEPALLVPEGTISVSRWLAKEYVDRKFAAPRKLYYVMPCFRNELTTKLSPTKGRQFHQAGVEILGSNDVRADLEVLLLAHEGFLRVGVEARSILIRLGSVGLFNAVCAETGLSGAHTLKIKDLMDAIAESRAGKQPGRLQPSIDAVTGIIAAYNATGSIMHKWQLMLNTYVDILNQPFVTAVGHSDEIASLNFLAETARSQGINCVIDPTVVRSHEYYTGIVYEIDIKLAGQPPLVEVAGGGRYNKLIGKFLDAAHEDVTVPAVGFAYGLERVVEIILGLQTAPGSNRKTVRLSFSLSDSSVDKVVADGTSGPGSALRAAAKLRDEGLIVDYYVGDDQTANSIREYAKRLGADVVIR